MHYTTEQLQEILERHRKWLYKEDDGKRADLRGAGLDGADLRGANLRGADLLGADLRGAKNAELAKAMTEIVPREGSFTGWKKAVCEDGSAAIVKLEIPSDAKRSNATGRKCRCSHALVIKITDIDGKQIDAAYSNYNNEFVYKVGMTVKADLFDDNRFNECSNGIHFFITREEARCY